MDRSNLIVNYLPSGFSENDLDTMFRAFGPLLSAKIVRDKTTGISMGFGFVNFESNSSASAAVAALNGKKLREDKIMKVSIARPAWKANIHSNLYLAGFPFTFSESDVMEFLGVHGNNAENVRLLRDGDRNPRGAAVVRMSSEESANGVIDAFNGIPFKGPDGTSSIIQVRPWRPEFRPDRISDNDIASTYHKSVGVYQKPPSMNKAMSGISSSNSSVTNSSYKENRSTGGSRKSASMEASNLLKKLTRDDSKGPAIKSRALPPTLANTPLESDAGEDCNESTCQEVFVLFVYHLPNNMDESALRAVFEEFGGQIDSVRVMPGKGYGFISYVNEKDAVYAMAKLNGACIGGSSRGIQIEIRTEVF